MPDHVHVIITPKRKEAGNWFGLGEIPHTNKSFTAHEINKAGDKGVSRVRCWPVWQDERFDRIIRDENELIEKWEYMRNNPVKAGLALRADDYSWLYLNAAAWVD